ncbi:hypothetical protein XTALMG727_3034 [Xanthomonas translucens pv. arrhenatheri LMG 727]|uniref:Uncharacterized protein n=1 Tax=Xanthomonas graminis pv. arrhenatheri LMG 727 TaxID=1195923 RepID=A0A0K3A1K2_9XANT|nr:hypothetical protein XTALMG727_3034 [Xanthomonas translucens pv. arrhenatheri LMG 727]
MDQTHPALPPSKHWQHGCFGTLATNEVCNGTHPACTNTKDCSLGSNTNCNNKGSCFTPNPGPGQG